MSRPFDLEGEVAIVTGASRALGRHVSAVLARAGAKVGVTDPSVAAVDDLAAGIERTGARALPVELDASSTKSIAQAVEVTETELGPVTILVNSAEIGDGKHLLETTEADWDDALAAGLRGSFLVAREVAGHMIRLGHPGRIVNVASVLGQTAPARGHAHAAAHAGLIHLTRSLALELARDGIRVNAVAAGFIETEAQPATADVAADEKLLARIPLGRLGTVEDLDGALLLLAGPASRYMTGSVITVDGGLSINAL
jgi:3-oxoacyl-[acyl-carrier protein] reductase